MSERTLIGYRVVRTVRGEDHFDLEYFKFVPGERVYMARNCTWVRQPPESVDDNTAHILMSFVPKRYAGRYSGQASVVPVYLRIIRKSKWTYCHKKKRWLRK